MKTPTQSLFARTFLVFTIVALLFSLALISTPVIADTTGAAVTAPQNSVQLPSPVIGTYATIDKQVVAIGELAIIRVISHPTKQLTITISDGVNTFKYNIQSTATSIGFQPQRTGEHILRVRDAQNGDVLETSYFLVVDVLPTTQPILVPLAETNIVNSTISDSTNITTTNTTTKYSNTTTVNTTAPSTNNTNGTTTNGTNTNVPNTNNTITDARTTEQPPVGQETVLPTRTHIIETEQPSYTLGSTVTILLLEATSSEINISNIRLNIVFDNQVFRFLGDPEPRMTFQPNVKGAYRVVASGLDGSTLDSFVFTVREQTTPERQIVQQEIGSINATTTDAGTTGDNNSRSGAPSNETIHSTSGSENISVSNITAPNISSEKTPASTTATSVTPASVNNAADDAFNAAFRKTSRRFVIRDASARAKDGTIQIMPRQKSILPSMQSTYETTMLDAQQFVISGPVDVQYAPIDSQNETFAIKNVAVQNLVGQQLDLGIDEFTNNPVELPMQRDREHYAWTNMYAVDPTTLNASNVTITVTARGSELFMCKDWDFANRACLGAWVKLRDVTPGQNYTITLDSADPGFGESIPIPNAGWVKTTTTPADTVTVRISSLAGCGNTQTNFQPGDTVYICINSSNSDMSDIQSNQVDVYAGSDPTSIGTYFYTCNNPGGNSNYCSTSFLIPDDWDGWYYLDTDIHRNQAARWILFRTPITIGTEPVDGDKLQFFADVNRTRPADKFGPGNIVYVFWDTGIGFNISPTYSNANIKTFHYTPLAGGGGNTPILNPAITWTNTSGPFLFNFTMPATLSDGYGGWYWFEPNVSTNATSNVPYGPIIFGRMILYQNNTPPNITNVTVNSPSTLPLSAGQQLVWNVTQNDTDEIDKHAVYICSTNGFSFQACSTYISNSTCTNGGCSFTPSTCGGTASICSTWSSNSTACPAAGCSFTAALCSGTASVCTTWNSNSTNCGTAGCSFAASTCTGTANLCTTYASNSTCTNASCTWNGGTASNSGQDVPSTNNGIGTAWTNPANAYTDNAVAATSTATVLTRTNYSGFVFNIPSGSTITGITARVSAQSTGGSGTNIVSISIFNGSAWSAYKSTADLAAGYVNTTLGTGTTDLWGLTWTNTTASVMWVNMTAPAANSRVMSVDALTVTVYYTTPSNCTGTPATCGSLAGNATQCPASGCSYTASACSGSPSSCGTWTGNASTCTTMGCASANTCSGTPSVCSTWNSNATSCPYFGCSYTSSSCSGTPTNSCSGSTICANTTWTLSNNMTCSIPANRTMNINNTGYAFVCDAWSCSAGWQINWSIYNDTQAPNVTLVTPINPSTVNNFTFTANFVVTDDYAIANCSLYVDIGGWTAVATNDTITNGTNNYITYTLPGDGTYSWNVMCTDFAGNRGTDDLNYSLYVFGPPVVNLKTPLNHAYLNDLDAIFGYNVTYSDTISECTLVINETDSAIDTPVATNTNNNISYSFIEDGNYTWNIRCTATDTTASFGDGVYDPGVPRDLIVDTQPPAITLDSPADGATINTSTVSFMYTPTDNFAIANCTLYVDGATVQMQSDIPTNETQSIPYLLDNGVHAWYVSCMDRASNSATTTTRSVIVNSSTSGGFIFYESNNRPGNGTNYAASANINLSTITDGNPNQVSYGTGGLALSVYARATGTLFQSNGILINPNAIINFSGYFGQQTANSGYVTWKFYKRSGATDTLICQSGNDFTGGTPITATAKTLYRNACTSPTTNTRVLGNETIKLTVGVYNNNNARRTFTHYFDNISTFVSFNFTRLGFLSVNISSPLIDTIAGINDTFNISCAYNCSGGTCINTQVYLQRNVSAGWQNLTTSGSPVILNTSDVNPHNLSNTVYPGGVTSFMVVANSAGVTNIRCWATSNYSNMTTTSSVKITVQTNGSPTISLVSPLNNSLVGTANVSLIYIPSSTKTIRNCSVYINGALNQTLNATANQQNMFNLTNPSEGQYRWNISCIDSALRTGYSITQLFFIDRSPPMVVANAPLNNTNFTTADITFNWTATDSLDTVLQCNLTIDGAANATNINSQNGTPTTTLVSGLKIGAHFWNITCYDDASNKNTSFTYQFNITNLAPNVTAIAPPNATWNNSAAVELFYNVTENDQRLYNGSRNYSAMAVYRSTTLTGVNYPKYRTWSGTAWGAETEIGNAGSPVRWVKMAASTTYKRPREKIAISVSDDGFIDAYVWNGSSWNITNNIGSMGTTSNADRSMDIEYESISGRAMLVYYNVSGSGTQDFAYNIWNGTAWQPRVNVNDPSLATAMRVDYMRLTRDPFSNTLGLVYIDATNNDARALIWDGTTWGNGVNVTNTLSVNNEEDIAIATEQQTGHILAAAGTGNNVAYASWNGSTWNNTGTFTLNTLSAQTTNYLIMKADPASNKIMIAGVDGGSDVATAEWSGSAFSGATRHDAGADTNAMRVVDFDWEQTGSKGLLVWGTTASQVAFKTYSASVFSAQVNVGTGDGNTHTWISLRRIPNPLSTDVRILGGFQAATSNALGSLIWRGSGNPTVAVATFAANQGTTTYQSFDISPDNFPQLNGGQPFYSLANCSLYLNGAYNQSNSSRVYLEYASSFNVTTFSEGTYLWQANCSDTDGASGASIPRTIYIDRTGPQINLTAPLNASNLAIFTINFSMNVTDNMASSMVCNLTLDGVVSVTNFAAARNANVTKTVSGMSDGVHYWNVTCVDFAGNYNTSATFMFNSSAPPIVTPISPSNNGYSNGSPLTLVYNVSENSAVSNCSLYLDAVFNTTNQSQIINYGRNNFTISNVSEGKHNWSVICIDDSGYPGQSTPYNVTIDRTPPSVQLNDPPTNSIVRSTVVIVNWTAIDNIDLSLTCSVTRKGPDGTDVSKANIASSSNQSTTATYAGIPEGQHWWNVTCVDDTGNRNFSATYTFNVSSPPSVTLVSPATSHMNNTGNITFAYVPYQSGGLANCTLIIDYQQNITNTIINNNVNNYFNVSNIADGPHNWSVNCTDTTGLTRNSSTWTFTIDKILPVVTTYNPQSASVQSNNTIKFNYSATDDRTPPLICTIYINNSAYFPNTSSTNGSVQSQLITLHGGNASYAWNVTCRDQAMNFNTSDVKLFSVIAPPSVTLLTPTNNSPITVNSTLTYRPSDPFGITNCSLYFDGVLNQTNTSVNNNSVNNFTINNIGPGSHNWTVSCIDVDGDETIASPFFMSVDTNPPSITLTAPDNGAVINTSNVTFNWTPYDDYSNSITCNLYLDGVNRATNVTLNNTPGTARINNIPDGVHPWNVTCVDLVGNTNTSDTWQVTVNQSPLVTQTSPSPGFTTNNGSITFRYTASDNDGFSNCTLYINGDANITNQSRIINNAANNFTVALSTGQYNWSVFCIDNGTFRLSNMTSNQSITVNLVRPIIILNEPPPGYLTNYSWIQFNWTATETFGGNLTCNISINGTVRSQNINSPSGIDILKNITSLNDSYQVWNVTCIDPAGNTNTSLTRGFTVTEPPQIVPINPTDLLRTKATTINFTFKPTDNSGVIGACSLIINGILNRTILSPPSGITTNITVLGMTNGTYIWSVNCTDWYGVMNTSVTRTLYIDLLPPEIALYAPPNEAATSTNVTFNWTAYDTGTVVTCNLTIDNIVNATNIAGTSGAPFIQSVPNIPAGPHLWNVTCWDDLLQVNTSNTLNFTIIPIDLVLNDSTRINFNNTNPNENDTINITANVSNIGGIPANNVIISFWDGNPSAGGIAIGNATTSLSINDSKIVSVPWNITLGFHTIYVVADQYNLVSESTKNNNNASRNISLLRVFYNAPPNGTVTNNPTIGVNFTIQNFTGGSFTYRVFVDGTANGQTGTATDNTPTAINLSALSEGFRRIIIQANDTTRAKNSTALTLLIDLTPPNISLQNPPPNARTNNATINFTFIPTDNFGNITSCSIIINGASNTTLNTPVNGSLASISVPGFINGTYLWSINCTDAAMNTGNSTTRTLYVDTYPPAITLIAPPNNTIQPTNASFVWMANDTGTNVSCNLTLDGVVNVSNINGTSGVAMMRNISNIDAGQHFWNVTCWDDLYQANTSATYNFSVNRADLIINDSSRIGLNNTNPNENDTLNITANISNYGGVAANNAVISFWDGLPSAGGIFIANATITLQPNQSSIVSAPWNITPGLHQIFISADPANTIAEMSDLNNNATRNFSLLRVLINSPPNATMTNSQTPAVNFTVQNFTGGSFTYRVFVDGTANGQTGIATDNVSSEININSLSEGRHTIIIQANDTIRAKNSTALTVIIDLTPPNGTFITANGTFFQNSPLNVTIRITDQTDPTLNYTMFVNNIANTTGSATNNTPTNVTLVGLSNGIYQLTIQSFDDAGNFANSTNLTIIVDNIPPTISLNSPVDNANFSVRTAILNYTPTDNLDTLLMCNVTVDSANLASYQNISNGSSDAKSATNLIEGHHYWNVTCWDGNNNAFQVNNVNTSETRHFGVYIPPNITLIAPANNTLSNSSTQAFIFNVTDETGISTCSLTINGVINDTKTGPQLTLNAYNNFTVTGVNNTVFWNITCIDNSTGLATSTSETRNLTVDSVAPNITIITANNTWFNTGGPQIQILAIDNYAQNIAVSFFVDGTINTNGTTSNGTTTGIALAGVVNGTHIVIAQATDTAGNKFNSSYITIYVDTVAPNVTLLAPANGANLSVNSAFLNFTATDNMASMLACNLTFDGIVVKQYNLTNGSVANYTTGQIASGNHYWNATCIDNATNRGTSQTFSFFINLPDLVINAGNITLSNSTPIEGQNITINATVFNVGLLAASNVTVQFWSGDPDFGGVQLGSNFTISLLDIGQNVTLTANYTTVTGLNQIFVVIDPPTATNGSIKEANESNNKAVVSFIVGLFEVFTGGSLSELRIADNNIIAAFTWNQTNITGSNVFVADTDSVINFNQLQAIGRNRTNATSSSNDFARIDIKLGTSNYTDSVNLTWTSGGQPIGYMNLTAFKRTINDVPIINSTNTSAFITGILWDMSDGGNQYNGSQDIIFTTVMNQSQAGQYGIYDYEIKIPALLRNYIPGGGTVTFYTELR